MWMFLFWLLFSPSSRVVSSRASNTSCRRWLLRQRSIKNSFPYRAVIIILRNKAGPCNKVLNVACHTYRLKPGTPPYILHTRCTLKLHQSFFYSISIPCTYQYKLVNCVFSTGSIVQQPQCRLPEIVNCIGSTFAGSSLSIFFEYTACLGCFQYSLASLDDSHFPHCYTWMEIKSRGYLLNADVPKAIERWFVPRSTTTPRPLSAEMISWRLNEKRTNEQTVQKSGTISPLCFSCFMSDQPHIW